MSEDQAEYAIDTIESDSTYPEMDILHEKVVAIEEFMSVSRYTELSQFDRDRVFEIVEFDKDKIEHALSVSLKKKIISLSYVLGILNNWKDGNVQRPVLSPMAFDYWARNAPFTNEFLSACESLNNTSGVYLFYDENPLYVGKSNNLSLRIISSFADKHLYYEKTKVKMAYIKCNDTDAGILELYFIAKLMPTLNKKDKSDHVLTLEIAPIPVFSDGIFVLNGASQ